MAQTSQRTANILDCLLDLLILRSNNQVYIDEINENVTEKKSKIIPVYSELSKYA